MFRFQRILLVPLLFIPMVGCMAMTGNKPVLPSAAIKQHDLSEASEAGSCEKKSDSTGLVRTWFSFAGIDQAPSVLKNGDDAKANGEKNGDKKEEGPKHIRDNAIFVEEAFNQEPGDAQHI